MNLGKALFWVVAAIFSGILAGCATQPGVSLPTRNIDAPKSCANLDALVKWWQIKSSSTHDLVETDVYEIYKKNSTEYRFRPLDVITKRTEWAAHKEKDYPLTPAQSTDGCRYLCVGLDMTLHMNDNNETITLKHFFAFQPPNPADGGQAKVAVGDKNCVEADSHGGTAHAQN